MIPAESSAVADAFPTASCEGGYVRGEVELLGPDLLCERCELALRRPVANDEAAAAPAQRPVEVGQAFEQELRPRTGRVAAVEQAVIEAEDGHDVVVGIQRRPQRRVLVQSQVAPEPDDRTHVPAGSGWSRSATARSR